MPSKHSMILLERELTIHQAFFARRIGHGDENFHCRTEKDDL
jgi:hypothetical protein